MRISLLFVFSLIGFFCFSQDSKKGSIRVEKSEVAGLYLYTGEKGTKTYIKIFKDSTVMLANNEGSPEYMEYWFSQMATNSNLPKGKLEFNEDFVYIEIKVAQSKEDNIILNGTFIDKDHLRLQRIGEVYDNNEYIFQRQN